MMIPLKNFLLAMKMLKLPTMRLNAKLKNLSMLKAMFIPTIIRMMLLKILITNKPLTTQELIKWSHSHSAPSVTMIMASNTGN